MGLSYIGKRIFEIGCDAGNNLVPAPPANTIPFIVPPCYFKNSVISLFIQATSIAQEGAIGTK